MKTLLCLAFLLICGSFASGQCQSTFLGNNQSQIDWCVTENGTIEYLGVSAGSNQVVAEGYGFCSGTGEYWVIGDSDSGNWQKSVITQPKGPNTLPLTILRASIDARVVVSQTYTWVGGNKAVGVKMKIQGNGTLKRYVETSAGMGNHTSSSAFAWSEGLVGLMSRPNSPTASASNMGGGLRNLCSGKSDNQNQGLMLTWQVFSPKNSQYFEYSTIR